MQHRANMTCAPAPPQPVNPIRARLQSPSGRRDDRAFDAIYPRRIRRASRGFWSPLAVACRAAELFDRHGVRRVLDVGSGPGKFCLAAALISPAIAFTGVEHRPHLVAAARRAASDLQVTNATFVHANATEVAWDAFDGFYFYNPFGENLFGDDDDRFDRTVELSGDRYMLEVHWTERRLSRLAVGSVVATYHGFGGRVPAAFELAHEESCGTDRLRIWVKTEAGQPGPAFWRELHEGGVKRGRFFDFLRPVPGEMTDGDGESEIEIEIEMED
jgi:predicted RNA methylase